MTDSEKKRVGYNNNRQININISRQTGRQIGTKLNRQTVINGTVGLETGCRI